MVCGVFGKFIVIHSDKLNAKEAKEDDYKRVYAFTVCSDCNSTFFIKRYIYKEVYIIFGIQILLGYDTFFGCGICQNDLYELKGKLLKCHNCNGKNGCYVKVVDGRTFFADKSGGIPNYQTLRCLECSVGKRIKK